MICPNCSTENDAGAKFCNECGTPVSAGCPNCGATNKPGAKFCNECGTVLTSTDGVVTPVALATGASEPVAERKLVTVLFADLVGFTPFAEERDAEEVRETLSRYFDLCSDIVARYGGSVEKFIGDAVMAVWGAPVAHEDDAERAVRAALELVDSVKQIDSNVQARAGVLTGEAAVTVGATNQGMVAGDLVNTASRLQSAAAPGTVLAGDTTYRATSDAIAYQQAGEHSLKGKAAPVLAWQALRVVAERGGRNRVAGLEAPFVGRADEMRLLRDLFHATGRERRARLVSVMGPAGIGKSRLAWEFLKYVDGLVETTYWHSGRSPAYGEGITFWALGEMVRGRCGLVEADDEQTTRQKVTQTVEEWVSDADERVWIEPALLTLLGIEADAASEQLFGAWRTFFERIAEKGTVTLVFEDMHFADSGLLDFVDHLLEWARNSPIYIVTLARPDLLEKRPDWGAGKRSFASIYLEPLPEGEMRELLTGIVPGLPEAAVRLIVERADGIPLYAVETVRMLVADGRLMAEGGVHTPVGDLTSLAVPETLTALIASRLDALEPTDRSMIHEAAVLGQSFTPEGLAAISGLDETEVQLRLATLVRRELLTRDVDPRSAERGQYVFVQALIREVAYNTVARKDRKRLHLAAARFFESLGSDELAGALAGHYLSAHANAADGPEADALAAQARIALRGAAERAANLGAYDQAVRFYEQALTVTTDSVEQADLLERAGDAARTAARYGHAETLLRRAVDLRRQNADRLGSARAIALLGKALLDGFRDEAAFDLLNAASAEFADLAPDPVVAELDQSLVRVLVMKNESRRALEVAERALDTAEPRGLDQIVARTLIAKGSALGHLGRKREGIGLIKVAEDLARERGFNEELISAILVGAFQKRDLDQAAALEDNRAGLALARRLGHRGRMLALVNNVGYTGFLVGEWDDALAQLESVLSDDLDWKDRISIMGNAAVIHAARGEPIDADLAEVKRLGADIPEEGWHVTHLDPEGNQALAEGRFQDARAAWRRLVELEPAQGPEFFYRAAVAALWAGDAAAAASDLADLDGTGVHGRVIDAERTSLRAGIAALDGHQPEALALYREAIATWRDLRGSWDEALTGITMTLLLDPVEPEVQRVAESTREILARLRAQPYIDRLDAALARSPATQPSVRPASADTTVAVEAS